MSWQYVAINDSIEIMFYKVIGIEEIAECIFAGWKYCSCLGEVNSVHGSNALDCQAAQNQKLFTFRCKQVSAKAIPSNN